MLSCAWWSELMSGAIGGMEVLLPPHNIILTNINIPTFLISKMYINQVLKKGKCKVHTHTSTDDSFDPSSKLLSTGLYELGVQIFTSSNLLEWFIIYRVKSKSVCMFWIPLNSNVMRLFERHVGVSDGPTQPEFPTSSVLKFFCM